MRVPMEVCIPHRLSSVGLYGGDSKLKGLPITFESSSLRRPPLVRQELPDPSAVNEALDPHPSCFSPPLIPLCMFGRPCFTFYSVEKRQRHPRIVGVIGFLDEIYTIQDLVRSWSVIMSFRFRSCQVVAGDMYAR